MKTGIILACVILGLVLVIFVVDTVCFENVKKSGLNAFLERYDNAYVVESSGPAYLIDTGEELVELNFQIDIDSSKLLRFKDKTTDVYIVNYERNHEWKRIATRASTSEKFELGEVSLTDRIFIDTDMLINLPLLILPPLKFIFVKEYFCHKSLSTEHDSKIMPGV